MEQSIPSVVSAELIRTAFERCPSGLLVVDRAGAITAVNGEVERLFGYTRSELVGQHVELLLPAGATAIHAGLRESYMQNPTARRMGAGRELAARHKDGREIPVEIGLSPIHTDEGLFILSTIVDVSERRALEERLRQMHKLEAIGSLASGIAHDFNNILLGIMGYVELARQAAQSLPDVVGDLDTVIGTVRRGRDLVNRILYFARHSEPSRAPTPVEGPVLEALQLLRATVAPNIEIRTGFDPATPPVVADPNELHQVAMNLATNAAYAMRESGGVLDVRVGPATLDESFVSAHPGMHAGLHVRLRVSDTGVGIPLERLGHIFDEFYTSKPAGEGTGLGLSVVGRIVDSLGGTIVVDSRVGEGTRFEVYLPAAPGVAPVAAMAPGDAQAKRILFVEDEPSLAQLGRRVLESLGYRVTACTSSPQALECYRTNPDQFDLLITDNTMPHMTGLELVEKILAHGNDIPVIMLSGVGAVMSPDELRSRDVRMLLAKPYQIGDLESVVREVLAPRAES